MSRKHKRWAWMKAHASPAAAIAIVFLSIIVSVVTYLMGYQVLTYPVIAGGVLIAVKEAIQYLNQGGAPAVRPATQ